MHEAQVQHTYCADAGRARSDSNEDMQADEVSGSFTGGLATGVAHAAVILSVENEKSNSDFPKTGGYYG